MPIKRRYYPIQNKMIKPSVYVYNLYKLFFEFLKLYFFILFQFIYNF